MEFDLSKDKILLKKNLFFLLFLVSTVISSLAENSEACKLDHFRDISSFSSSSSYSTFFSDRSFVLSDALSFDLVQDTDKNPLINKKQSSFYYFADNTQTTILNTHFRYSPAKSRFLSTVLRI
ncbi:MAG TPA: hypothetical protein VHP36_09705 [Chitinispirillaceae bacterium]|nr:hypothetical protein [Chitinispirillaceae bacterium]